MAIEPPLRIVGSSELDPSDAELLRRARAGHDTAFEELVGRYSRALYGLAYFLVGQSVDAEDLVQETFLAAYEGMSTFESRAAVKTWLTRILFKRAARYHRSKQVRKVMQPLTLSAESTAWLEGRAGGSPQKASEIRMDVLEVLKTLSPEHREVVVLREMDGRSYQEMAEILGIPQGTVESRLFRAREELKERLKSYLG